jgi:hypothetical protein
MCQQSDLVYGLLRPLPSFTRRHHTEIRTMRPSMQTILYHSTTIAVIAVFVVLLFGLYTMMRGTSPNLSQKIMRWRVGLQFIAIIIIMAAVYVKKHFV